MNEMNYNVIKTLQCTSHVCVEIVADKDNQMYICKTFDWPSRHLAAREIASAHVLGKHPNITPLLHFCYINEPQKCIQLFYKYAAKGDLFDFLKMYKSADLNWIAKVFSDVVKAVDYIHRRDLIHRDIKLENVVLTADGTAQLCDFSLCEWIINPIDSLSPNLQLTNGELEINIDSSLRKHATDIVGTQGCLSPEIAIPSSSGAQKESDIFSLGVLLYEMLTEHNAFAQLSHNEQTDEMKFPRWITGDLRALLSGMLRYDIYSRHTISDILANPWIQKHAKFD